MSRKVFNIIDNSPLEDGKLFLVRVDDVPGVAGSEIIRTYEGVDDAPVRLYGFGSTDDNGRNVSWDTFKENDTILVQYRPNVTEPGYYLVRLVAHSARRSRVLWNGNSEAGYTSEIAGDVSDNSEDFQILTGLKVGYGGENSSESILVKKELNVDYEARFGKFSSNVFLGKPFNGTNSNLLIGFNTLTEPFTLGIDYDEEYSFLDTDVAFNGNSVITGLTLNGEPVGDILIDVYDPSDVLIGRFEAEVIDQTEIHIKNANLPAVLGTGSHTIGTIRFPTNSIVIGHNTEMPKSNEIIIGAADGSQTVRIRGPVVTDSPLTGSAVLSDLTVDTTTFDFTGTVATFASGTSLVIDADTTINGELFITGNPVQLPDDTSFVGNTNFTNTGSKTKFYGQTVMNGIMTVNNTATFANTVDINNDLNCQGNVSVHGSNFLISADVDTIFSGTVTFQDVVNINGSLNLSGVLTATNSALTSATLTDFTSTGIALFEGAAAFEDTVHFTAGSNFTCLPPAYFEGNDVTIRNGGTLVVENTVNPATFGVGGIASLGNVTVPSIDIAGNASVGGTLTIENGLTVNADNVQLYSQVQIHDLVVTDDTYLLGNLGVSGNVGFFGTTPITQPVAIADATADLTNVKDRLNDVIQTLRDLGLIDT